MSLPNTIRAYQDCQRLFETATQGAKGARAKLPTHAEALNLRTRLHYFRKLDRGANAATYPSDHPMHGQSIYDEYVVQILPDQDAGFWVYITKRSSNILIVETLDEEDTLIDVESTEVHQIEDHT